MQERPEAVVPSTSFAGDGQAARLAREERRRRLGLHARRLAAVSAFVLATGALASAWLAQVGTRSCEETPQGERCVKTSWYALTFQPRVRVETLNGVPDGEHLEWYKNGQLWFAGRYEKGVKVGPWREHWSHGAPRFAGTYVDGRLEGEETWWFPTGSVEWKTHRARGKRSGLDLWFFEDGTLRREGRYKDGERDGRFTVYRPDGVAYMTGTYLDGVRLDGAAEEI